jgi:hypothetical protein
MVTIRVTRERKNNKNKKCDVSMNEGWFWMMRMKKSDDNEDE